MHKVSKKDLNCEDFKKSDDGGNSQRRGGEQQKRQQKMSGNWIYS